MNSIFEQQFMNITNEFPQYLEQCEVSDVGVVALADILKVIIATRLFIRHFKPFLLFLRENTGLPNIYCLYLITTAPKHSHRRVP